MTDTDPPVGGHPYAAKVDLDEPAHDGARDGQTKAFREPTHKVTTAFFRYSRGVGFPRSNFGQFIYGLAQPFYGLVVLSRHRSLRNRALVPVLAVLVLCGLTAANTTVPAHLPAWSATWRYVLAFSTAFAVLAPVPPTIFARHYARLAAASRPALGLAPGLPHLKTMTQGFREGIRQTLIIAFGLLPATAAVGLVPVFGAPLALALQALWTLHWMTIEALDNGRTDEPEQAVSTEEPSLRRPWFTRHFGNDWPRGARWLLAPLHWPLRQVERYSRDWSGELAVVEGNPAATTGFALGIALLLALPGLNLLFRPAVTIASVRLRSQLTALSPSNPT